MAGWEDGTAALTVPAFPTAAPLPEPGWNLGVPRFTAPALGLSGSRRRRRYTSSGPGKGGGDR